MINAEDLVQRFTLEEHCQKAELYFQNHYNSNHLRGKPFIDINETVELLHCLAETIAGLKLQPGMKILDFGAGTCWVSKMLTQMGMEVTSLDVSQSALKIGKEMYDCHPPVGNQPINTFLHFDGKFIKANDNCFDRVICFDSFHHVPNIPEVLKEMYRVLKPKGIAGFSEPGANHSQQDGSQQEMKVHQVIERDVDIQVINNEAKTLGFKDMKIAVLNVFPHHLSPQDFTSFINTSHENLDQNYCSTVRNYLWRRRIFFLQKG